MKKNPIEIEISNKKKEDVSSEQVEKDQCSHSGKISLSFTDSQEKLEYYARKLLSSVFTHLLFITRVKNLFKILNKNKYCNL